jgi:hypothetical protein
LHVIEEKKNSKFEQRKMRSCGQTPASELSESESKKCMEWMQKPENWKLLERRRGNFRTIEEFNGFLLAKCLGRWMYWVEKIKFQ